MDARGVIAAAEPTLTLRHVPQRRDKLPAFAAIIRAKQSGGNGADPQPAAGFHGPDLKQRWRIGGVGGKCRRGELAPRRAIVVRAMQLGAEMTVFERGIDHTIGSQNIGHRDAVEANESRDPACAFAFEREQAFARRYQQMIAHYLFP
jgi:hypothetical protein